MKFTYEEYKNMLIRLSKKRYVFCDYKDWAGTEKTVIIRHDVDYSLKDAAILSEIEKELDIRATYFVLISTNFYNVHSKESRAYISSIIKNGGNIGLHFDETQYNIQTQDMLKNCVYKEIEILSDIIDAKVDTVSMHRPSEKFLSADIEFENIVNSYSSIYFKNMKYLSDSRRCWREDIDGIIEKEAYKRLHILTHPFWYKYEEMNLRHTLKEAILNASLEYYDNMNDNFRDLQKEIDRTEIERQLDMIM